MHMLIDIVVLMYKFSFNSDWLLDSHNGESPVENNGRAARR